MNKLYHTPLSFIRKALFVAITVAFLIILTIPIVQASGTVIALPQSEATLSHAQRVQQLITNTPRVGYFDTHWDDFVASINWADYSLTEQIYVSTNCFEAC